MLIMHGSNGGCYAGQVGNTTGTGNPRGFAGRVPDGSGTGCLFGTRAKPVPVARVLGKPRVPWYTHW